MLIAVAVSIGDYRRIALYGVDYLIEEKKEQFSITMGDMLEEVIRDREEIQDQIRSLKRIERNGCILRLRYF